MRVTVFGATTALGRHVVDDLSFRGHDVVAHADGPAELPECWRGTVDVVAGDLADPVTVDTAVARGEAVVNALGPDRDGVPAHLDLPECTRRILESMRGHDVRRYVGLGTCRVLDPEEHLSVPERVQQLATLSAHPRGHREMTEVMRTVMASDVEWTLVRYLVSREGEPRGIKRVGLYGKDHIGASVTRADVAHFIAAQVLDRDYIGVAPAVSN